MYRWGDEQKKSAMRNHRERLISQYINIIIVPFEFSFLSIYTHASTRRTLAEDIYFYVNHNSLFVTLILLLNVGHFRKKKLFENKKNKKYGRL